MKDLEPSEEIPAVCYLSTAMCLHISNAPAVKGRIFFVPMIKKKGQRKTTVLHLTLSEKRGPIVSRAN